MIPLTKKGRPHLSIRKIKLPCDSEAGRVCERKVDVQREDNGLGGETVKWIFTCPECGSQSADSCNIPYAKEKA